jgi:hypothetical protein
MTFATPEAGGGCDGGTGAAWSVAADGEACVVAGYSRLGRARKARAFRSLDKLTLRHGGHALLYGAALALAAARHRLRPHHRPPSTT